MNFEEGLEVADEAIFLKMGRRLNHVEIAILNGSWQGQTYEKIANTSSYSVGYLKRHIGPELWRLLTIALGEQVSKTNFRPALERKWRSQQRARRDSPLSRQMLRGRYGEHKPLLRLPTHTRCDWGEAIDVSLNFQNANLTSFVFAETLSGLVAVAFSPDGRLLATGDIDGQIRLWQVTDGKQVLTLPGHRGWVWTVTFSPDGHLVASSGHDSLVRLWNAHDGQCLKALQGHTSGVRSVTFSPDGRTLASGSNDSSVRLWDVSNGQCRKVLLGHTSGICSVTFCPGGKTLASGSFDCSVRLWDVHTGTCLKTLHDPLIGSAQSLPLPMAER